MQPTFLYGVFEKNLFCAKYITLVDDKCNVNSLWNYVSTYKKNRVAIWNPILFFLLSSFFFLEEDDYLRITFLLFLI